MSVLPPRPKGPHLNAMRSFEAAARLGGFAAAAEELSVTPGAVSQQVKALEMWIGAPLFLRQRHGVTLTGLGQTVLADFTAAFDALGNAMQVLRAEAPNSTVHIAALPSIAQLWLAPRLAKIRAMMPNQAVSITALETPPNLQRELFDLSIFFADAPLEKGCHVITKDKIFPVCTPQLASQLRHPADLVGQTLIHDATWCADWEHWLKSVGQPADGMLGGPVYSLYAIAVDETLGGAGVLMGHEALIAEHLQAGRLVRPFDAPCLAGRSLVLNMARPFHPTSPTARVSELLKNGA